METKLTMKVVGAALRAIGVTMRKTEYGEYRVNFRGGTEATACYTDDLRDALDTGIAMVRPIANPMALEFAKSLTAVRS